MKLLLDQNLAPALARRLADVWPGSRHVRDCGLERGSDLEVWMYAIQEAFVIVSKDADFHQLSFLKGAPPKVIWVRRGNAQQARSNRSFVTTTGSFGHFWSRPRGRFSQSDSQRTRSVSAPL